MICHVAQRVMKGHQGPRRPVAVEGTLEGLVQSEGPIAAKDEGSVRLAVAIAGKGQCVGKAETESKREERRGAIRERQAQGMGVGKSAIAGIGEVQRDIQGPDKVHREAAHEIEVVSEVMPTDKAQVTDKVKVAGQVTSASTGADDITRQVTGAVTGAGVSEVVGEVGGEIEVASEVANTIKVAGEVLHAMTQTSQAKNRMAAHRQPRRQIP